MPMRFRTLSSPAVPGPNATPVEVPPHAHAGGPNGRRPSLPFLTVDPHYNATASRSSLTCQSATDLRTPQSPYSRQSTRRSSRQSRQSTFAPPWASTLDFTAGYTMSKPDPEPVVWGGEDDDGDMDVDAPMFTNPWGVDGENAIQPERYVLMLSEGNGARC